MTSPVTSTVAVEPASVATRPRKVAVWMSACCSSDTNCDSVWETELGARSLYAVPNWCASMLCQYWFKALNGPGRFGLDLEDLLEAVAVVVAAVCCVGAAGSAEGLPVLVASPAPADPQPESSTATPSTPSTHRRPVATNPFIALTYQPLRHAVVTLGVSSAQANPCQRHPARKTHVDNIKASGPATAWSESLRQSGPVEHPRLPHNRPCCTDELDARLLLFGRLRTVGTNGTDHSALGPNEQLAETSVGVKLRGFA